MQSPLPFPSASPALAAFNLAAISERPGLAHLVSREARDLSARFLADRPRFRFWLDLIRRRGFHRWFARFEAFTVPGMALHQALRKLALEEAVIHALEAGMEQIVILGGGLDSLGARLARRYPDARFLEIGPAAALASKRKVLEHSGFLSRNLSHLPMDFRRHGFPAALESHPEFRPGEPAFFLCEDVLMYLDPLSVEKLFRDLAALPCPALRLAFTFMEPDACGTLTFRGTFPLLGAWLRRRGARFTWGLPSRDLGAFLARRGFALEEIADAGVFRSRFLKNAPAAPLAEGEKVAIASALRK
jgi:methyltransferase (TIGR00027 family)